MKEQIVFGGKLNFQHLTLNFAQPPHKTTALMSLVHVLGESTIASLCNSQEEEWLLLGKQKSTPNSLAFLSNRRIFLQKLRLKFTAYFIRGVFMGLGGWLVDFFVIKRQFLCYSSPCLDHSVALAAIPCPIPAQINHCPEISVFLKN